MIVSYDRTLLYYDGPQVIEAHDSDGRPFIGVWIETAESDDQHLFVNVDADRLNRFKDGDIDLRSLLLDRSSPDWYVSVPGQSLGSAIQIVRQTQPLSESHHLPDAGLRLCSNVSEPVLIG